MTIHCHSTNGRRGGGTTSSLAAISLAGRKRPAFTLIELLVVIAILALLLSILLPSLRKVKKAVRTAACRSNLHHVGELIIMYSTDYNGLVPGGTIGTRGFYADPDVENFGGVKGWYWFLLYGFPELEGQLSSLAPCYKPNSPFNEIKGAGVGLIHCPDTQSYELERTTGRVSYANTMYFGTMALNFPLCSPRYTSTWNPAYMELGFAPDQPNYYPPQHTWRDGNQIWACNIRAHHPKMSMMTSTVSLLVDGNADYIVRGACQYGWPWSSYNNLNALHYRSAAFHHNNTCNTLKADGHVESFSREQILDPDSIQPCPWEIPGF